jgi:UDP-3-O-[3-hydroxymyristoyl] glucosamine N-acyltransferase
VAVSLEKLAKLIGAELHGDGSCKIEQVATLDNARAGQIACLFDRKYRKFLNITGASAVIIQQQYLVDCDIPALVTSDPHLAYARVSGLLNQPKQASGNIHPSAVIADDARIGNSCDIGANAVIGGEVTLGEYVIIGPGCVIEEGAVIGDYSRLLANITICHHVSIGKKAIIHPGAVIGSDGFGLANDKGKWIKIPQIGSVRIGDEVEVGANTTIDRGALKDTIIEDGAKLDNQIQIAHNVRIGEHSALAGCVGIAGSAAIGKRCMIGGGVGISGHIEIADDVTITGMSLVTKSIRNAGTYSSGWPVRDARVWRKTVGRVHRLEAEGKKPQSG